MLAVQYVVDVVVVLVVVLVILVAVVAVAVVVVVLGNRRKSCSRGIVFRSRKK